jgi:hypothetical protein
MKVLVIASALVLISSCANIKTQPPLKQDIVKSKSYSISYEKAWIRAVDWFADHNVTIEKIEKSSGLLTAKYLIEANDKYLDCGNIKATGTLNGYVVDKNGSLNVTVRLIDDDTTKVNVNFFGEYVLRANDSWDGRQITAKGLCLSTGNLETSILSYISN